MPDASLRALERRSRATADAGLRARWLRAAVRKGLLDRAGLGLAAYLGDDGARLALGVHATLDDAPAWATGLVRDSGQDSLGRVAVVVLERLVRATVAREERGLVREAVHVLRIRDRDEHTRAANALSNAAHRFLAEHRHAPDAARVVLAASLLVEDDPRTAGEGLTLARLFLGADELARTLEPLRAWTLADEGDASEGQDPLAPRKDPERRARILVTTGAHAGREHVLAGGETVGRAPSTIVFEDASLAREHARFAVDEDGRAWLETRGSFHKRRALAHGDEVALAPGSRVRVLYWA